MATPDSLTSRQRDVLAFVERALATQGRPPTRAEIAAALGFKSPNAAEEHLRALERKGYLAIDGSHRGLRVLSPSTDRDAAGDDDASARARGSRDDASDDAAPGAERARGKTTRRAAAGNDDEDPTRLPLIGRVAAGRPILAQAHVERHVRIDPDLFRPVPDFLLRVVGASMRDAGILDGDWVAVRAGREGRHGQIVVARLGEDATVKRLERRGDRVRLLPANPDFAPIVIGEDGEPLVIEGVVVGVIRRMEGR